MATVKKMKKAQDGDNLKTRQYKRLGRIAEKNPVRAERVADRMNTKAGRVDRGKEIATGSRALYSPSMMDMMRRNDREERLMMEMKKEKNGGKTKKYKAGGSLSALDASNKRVGPVDPKGAYTKVQKKALAGAKGKATLKKDKQLGATKMKMGGAMKKCKYGCK